MIPRRVYITVSLFFFLLGRTVGSLGPKYSSYLYVIASIYRRFCVYIEYVYTDTCIHTYWDAQAPPRTFYRLPLGKKYICRFVGSLFIPHLPLTGRGASPRQKKKLYSASSIPERYLGDVRRELFLASDCNDNFTIVLF